MCEPGEQDEAVCNRGHADPLACGVQWRIPWDLPHSHSCATGRVPGFRGRYHEERVHRCACGAETTRGIWQTSTRPKVEPQT